MKLLIVVDMQNDFLNKDGKLYIGHDTKELQGRVANFVKAFDGDIMLTMDRHSKGDPEFKLFPEHCIEETEGTKIVEPIEDAIPENKAIIRFVKKGYTSACIVNNIIDWCEGKENPEIHITGVCTSICVHDVVTSIINEMKNQDKKLPKIIVHKDLVDDLIPEAGEAALQRMLTLYGITVQNGSSK